MWKSIRKDKGARTRELAAAQRQPLLPCIQIGVRRIPRDYVVRRRIEVAQAMMLTTSEPLHSIALSCGMCDQQHFTRSFRRIVGETPSMWRRTRRGSLKVD
jgi:transcriptional regulator GlxA family with amidase domain